MPVDRSVGNYYDSSSSFLRRVARWTGPNPYVAGGEPVTPATFGLGKIVAILTSTATNAAGAPRTVAYNAATGKLMWFDAAGAEAAGDLSAFSAGIEVIGN